MKKKIFIALMLLFVASFCFAVKFDTTFVHPKGIMSKTEFNDYVIKFREDIKNRNKDLEQLGITWRHHILDDSYKISKYERNHVINAILNEYDVETGEVYDVHVNTNSYPFDSYDYEVRINKVHKSGKFDFTIKAIAITG